MTTCRENMLYFTIELTSTYFFLVFIRIYFGTIEIFDVFNPKSFIYYDIHDPAPALKKIEMLENNEIEYAKVMAAPILLEGNATFQKYFSLSDEIIPNAKLKKEIRNMVNYRCKYDE